jgi:hypothetical protein
MFSFHLVDRAALGAILMSRGELCSPSGLFKSVRISCCAWMCVVAIDVEIIEIVVVVVVS